MKTPAPIVLFVFNRPDHMSRVVEALAANQLAAESVLYVFSDAPRGPQDKASVQEVRRIAHQISGFKEVIVIEREQNLGCEDSELTGISEILSTHDRCIIVEDDVLPYPLFLTYMNEALEFYKEDASMFSIAAYGYSFDLPASYTEDTFLLDRTCSWGWGTWKTAWEKISLNLNELRNGLSDARTRTLFARNGEDLLRTYERTPEAWDLRISFQQWKLGLHTLIPARSMVRNIGRDGTGLHYHGGTKKATEVDNAPDRLPKLTHLTVVDDKVRKAFAKQFHKPLWRQLAVRLFKALGLYGFIERRIYSF
ncbi:MAG: glycosyltransferase [Bacteroidota bacterium]|nr:glycosyltransferase [Bacteroidota bacterium]